MIDDELRRIYDNERSLDPRHVVQWARAHPSSELHGRFEWDNAVAGEEYRIWQAREIIVSVRAVYEDGKMRQVYVSPFESRGKGGYVALVEVLGKAETRAAFLDDALAELRRFKAKYASLAELAEVFAAVRRVSKGSSNGVHRRRKRMGKAPRGGEGRSRAG